MKNSEASSSNFMETIYILIILMVIVDGSDKVIIYDCSLNN